MSAPLTLVDGVPRSFSNVDPEDIESFSILKDASATAVYGVRGANGVILVNTRRGFEGPARIDLRYEQGFSFATNAAMVEEKKDFRYYTRHINSIVLPIVWQPHVYMLRHRVRVYLEAAATFSYHLSSTYEDEAARASGVADWKGDYSFKLPRDNRWGYGLAGGGGIALLIRRFEINVRARYYFGLSDIVRNRNKYADNGIDVPKTRSGRRRCVRRSTTSPFRSG